MNLFFNLLSCKFQVICLDGNASRKRFLSKCPQIAFVQRPCRHMGIVFKVGHGPETILNTSHVSRRGQGHNTTSTVRIISYSRISPS